MLSKTHATLVHSAAPGVIPDTITAPGTNGGVSTQPAKPAHGQPESGRDSAPSERDERRDREERQHQRAARREANGPEPGAKASGRLHQAQSQATAPSGRTRLALGKTVPLRLIGIIVVGLIVGAILGAASAPGWVIGLLVVPSANIGTFERPLTSPGCVLVRSRIYRCATPTASLPATVSGPSRCIDTYGRDH
jgi:hypothetical protein